MAAKTKLSVTVSRETLAQVDRHSGGRARSSIVEQALALWLQQQRKIALDRSIEAYYRSLEQSEKRADREWAGLADDTVTRQWD